MNYCTIYYGMSGSLKLATITSNHKYDFKVYSDTKPFYDMDRDYFNWSSRPNDAHLAIHRLLTLSLDGYLPSDKNIAIERGVTDNVFCIPNRKIEGLSKYSDIDILGLVKLERNIISSKCPEIEIRKILLVMKDSEFILSHVINEPHRRSLYPNLNEYYSKQDEYVEFTTKYNTINKTIIINDAKDYIINDLNMKYNE